MFETKSSFGRFSIRSVLFCILFSSVLLSAFGDEGPNVTGGGAECKDCNSICKDVAESRVHEATTALKTKCQDQIDLLQTSMTVDQERVKVCEAARTDLTSKLAEAATVEAGLRKELESQQATLQKNSNIEQELRGELSKLQKSLGEQEVESAKQADRYKAKLLEAKNKQNDLQRELLDAKELIRDLEKRAIPMRVNTTLMLEDVYDFADAVKERYDGFEAWLQESWDVFASPYVELIKKQYEKHVVPVLEPVQKSAAEMFDKVHAVASSSLKEACQKSLAYLEINVQTTQESTSRKWVVDKLEYAEKNADVIVGIAGQGILLFVVTILILSLTRKRNTKAVAKALEKSKSSSGSTSGENVDRTKSREQ